jgi:hypothetical protein
VLPGSWLPGLSRRGLSRLSRLPWLSTLLSRPSKLLSRPSKLLRMPSQLLRMPSQLLRMPGQLRSGPGQLRSGPGQLLRMPRKLLMTTFSQTGGLTLLLRPLLSRRLARCPLPLRQRTRRLSRRLA